MSIMTVQEAVALSRSSVTDKVTEARDFAEHLGYHAFTNGTTMPPAFTNQKVLRNGFQEGWENARCSRALSRAGLL